MQIIKAEYIWLDGAKPTQTLRSKTRFVPVDDPSSVNVDSFPEWSFDGSSTGQSPGGDSDLGLKPVFFCEDPTRIDGFLVLAEVLNPNGTAHESNTRAKLRKVLAEGGSELDAWIGFEQEYTLFQEQRPLGFPVNGYPAPQGPFYCGVGADRAFGRELVETHIDACLEAGLMLYGVNAEVMPGQWEFQIGYRGMKGESADMLNASDHLWVARWLMHRIAEDADIIVSFDVKPMKGDWNGAGMHTNFSTAAMRAEGGIKAINEAIEKFAKKHDEHIAVYGHALADRLTGLHETAPITEFRHGVADRGASIRVPRHVAEQGSGYLEDRRPGANSDPWLVSARLLTTVLGLD